MQGYRRGIARKKETGIMKNFEGKVPVSMMIYSGLSRLALFANEARGQRRSRKSRREIQEIAGHERRATEAG
jgi:hypothetical protein